MSGIGATRVNGFLTLDLNRRPSCQKNSCDPNITHYSSFHFLFHYPNITDYSGFHFSIIPTSRVVLAKLVSQRATGRQDVKGTHHFSTSPAFSVHPSTSAPAGNRDQAPTTEEVKSGFKEALHLFERALLAYSLDNWIDGTLIG